MNRIKQFFHSFAKWFDWKDKSKLILIIALVAVFFGAFLGQMINTDFYRFDVYSQTIETHATTSKGEVLEAENGKPSRNTADIYKPKSASAEDPVPLVFVVPGIQRTKETQASFCIELARRGYAVICIDPYAQGESTSSYENQSATQEGYGLFHWMDYLFEDDDMYTLKEEWSWIDATRIGACGHSAGGNACQKLAEREGKFATENKKPSRVNGVYITGYIRGWSWTNTQCNIGISYSKNDEGAFQNKTYLKKVDILAKQEAGETLTAEEEWWLTVGNADLRYAQESVDIVNFQLNRAGEAALPKTEVAEGVSVSTVEIDAFYGNPYTYTYAVIHNESSLHALMPYDGETLINLVNFFEYTFDTESGLAPTNQIWWLKELGGVLSLVGGFMFICSLCVLLLRTKAFASIKKEVPARGANQKIKGRIIFWISFVLSAVIACVLYMVCVKWSVAWFPDAATGVQTWFFPQRFTNGVMLWAVANGLIGAALFFLAWGIKWLIDHVRAKKGKIAETTTADVKKSYLSQLGPVKIGGKDFLKTLGLAAILIGSFFALDYLIYGIFHTDMRFLFISARVTFNGHVIAATLMYLPFFFIFYFTNSMRVNCSMRPENWKEWLSQIIAVLGNTLGLIAILLIEYIPMMATGTIGYTDTVGPQWLFVNLLFSVIPMMALLPLLNRFFFNKTGKAWLGPLVTCVIFIAMMTGATTIYYII